jgi:Tfp pilus assembly PilM family ATPase
MAANARKAGVSPIAFDFGVSSLKAIQVAYGDTPECVAAAALPTPPELLMRDRERVAFQIAQLPVMLRGAGFKGRRAACTISAQQTFVARVLAPVTPGVSTRQALGQYLVSSVGLDPSLLILRETEVGEMVSPDGKRKAVLCVAMPRDVVRQYMDGLRSAKLEPVGMHAEHTAVVRLFDCITRETKRSEPAHALYVDVGYGSTKLLAARGRELVTAATVPIGGRDFDSPAAREAGSSLADARKRRLEQQHGWEPACKSLHGDLWQRVGSLAAALTAAEEQQDAYDFAQAAGAFDSVEDRETPDEAPAGVNALNAIAEELGMFTRSHQAVFPESVLARTIFVGGEVRDAGVAEHLSACAGLPGAVCDPIAGLKNAGGKTVNGIDFTTPRPDWAVTLGLAFSPTDL